MTRKDLSKFQKAILISLVLVVALATRLYRLGHESFWVDEVHQIRVASQSLSEIVENYRQDTPHETHDQAPLSMIITRLFLTESNPEFSARVPSVLLGVLSVLALFFVANRLLPFMTSLTAAFFMAISPLAVWYSQDARWYSQWCLGTIISYLTLLVVSDKPRDARVWCGYFVATLANIYTFVYTVIILLAQGISLLWRKIIGLGRWGTILVFSCVNAAVFAFAIPVILMIVQRAETDQFYSGTARASSLFELPYTFLTFATGFTVGPSLARLHDHPSPIEVLFENPELVVVGLVFVPITLVGLVKVFREPHLASWLVPWLVTPPAFVFSISLFSPELTYQIRYVFASLPAFVTVLAIGVSSLKPRLRGVAFVSVIVMCVFSLANFYWNEKYDKADARSAIEHVMSEGGQSIQLVAVGQIEYAMYYYADNPRIGVFRGCGKKTGMEEGIDEGQAVWLISGRDWNRDNDRCLPTLNKTHTIAQFKSFTGVELWRLEPRSKAE
jgi:uncharacterized membrane protein